MTLVFQVSSKRVWPRPISVVNPTWLYVFPSPPSQRASQLTRLSHSLFSPNVSSLKLPTRILHILSLQMSGLSVCPLSSLPRDVTPTHRRRMRMCLRSCRRLCMALRQRCHLGTAIMRMISLPSGTSLTPFSSSLNLTMLIMSAIFSLEKDPNRRPTYAQLLEHPFLVADKGAEVDMVGWVEGALKRKAERGIASLNPIQPPVPLEP